MDREAWQATVHGDTDMTEQLSTQRQKDKNDIQLFLRKLTNEDKMGVKYLVLREEKNDIEFVPWEIILQK